MCFQSQVHPVQQQTEDVLSDMEAFLALDKQAGHEDEVAISAWRAIAAVQNKSSAGYLPSLQVALQEKENMPLRAQQGHEYCSLCHDLPPSGMTSIVDNIFLN